MSILSRSPCAASSLIEFGADLQKRLDAMPKRSRRCPYAGVYAGDLFKIAKALHALDEHDCNHGLTPSQETREAKLEAQAQEIAGQLGKGVIAYRQGDPRGWPLYIIFPGDIPKREGMAAHNCYSNGVGVPPRA